MIKTVLILLSIFFISKSFAQSTDCTVPFNKAGDFFSKGDYKQAIDNYKITQLCLGNEDNDEIIEFILKSEACLEYYKNASTKILEENYYGALIDLNKILSINYTDTKTKKKARFCYDKLMPVSNMIFIDGGNFLMGNNNSEANEAPEHKVTINGFYMDPNEVTNFDFSLFLNANFKYQDSIAWWINMSDDLTKIEYIKNWYKPIDGYENYPVVNVSWYGAMAFARWCGKDLPTEAEWEYACRGGIKSKNYLFSGSNISDSVAVHRENSRYLLSEIKTKLPNELGLYDMSGNVLEWCKDDYKEYYFILSPDYKPDTYTDTDYKSVRGGSYYSYKKNLTSTYRNFQIPDDFYYAIGFRCVKRI